MKPRLIGGIFKREFYKAVYERRCINNDIIYNLITMTPSLFPDEQMAKAMLNQLIKNIECVSIYNQMLDITDDPNDIKETFFKEDISKLKIFKLIPKKVKEN